MGLLLGSMTAEDIVVHEKSATPTSGRYEIVESPLLARLAFKLDKFTGSIWQLVIDKKSELKWEPMAVHGLVRFKSETYTAPRYQIFMSGRAAMRTFLIDSLSGRTWIYTKFTDESVAWAQMEDLNQ